MLSNNNHIIKTLCFDTTTASEALAVAFADKLKTIDCESLVSKALHNYDVVPDNIHIDTIMIDVGNVDLDDFEFLEEEIIRQLEEAIGKNVSTLNLIQNKIFSADDVTVLSGTQIKTGAVESKIEILIYYLQQGALRWNVSDRPDIKSLLFEIAKSHKEYIEQFIISLLRNDNVTQRLLSLLNENEVVEFVKIFKNDEAEIVDRILNLFIQQYSLFGIQQRRKEIAFILLKSLHQSVIKKEKFSSSFIQLLVPVLNEQPIAIVLHIKAQAEKLVNTSLLQHEQVVYQALSDQIQNVIDQKNYINTQLTEQHKKFDEVSSVIKEKDEEYINAREEESESGTESESASYFIDNAGIVLLNAALMQQYFENFGWIKNKNILDEASRSKIIVWTGYLVYNERKLFEYDLMLNKVFGGMHPADVCDTNIQLSASEKAAADEYLETVISYWSALKNTSVHGFRTSFLQRNARLSNEDGGWQLHVQSKAYDILIESLPWTFSIIKFPWMTKPLFTQWQTRV
ncbi:MAG: hypothetical protein JO072_08030 [Parafilimonas sp.]|nr:hypothetical protein [Parafilimonas sp.]